MKVLTLEIIFLRTVDCCLILMLTANIHSVIQDKKNNVSSGNTQTQMAEQLALTFPSDTFFVGVGAQAPHWPQIHLSGIGSLNVISHIPQIIILPLTVSLCAFSWGMVSILCPRWWPYPLAPSSSM